MPHQSLPDNFYYMIYFFAMLLLLAGRAWEFVLILAFDRRAGSRISQRSRLFIVGTGLGVSSLAVAMLFTQYSIHQTEIGLNQMYAVDPTMGVVMWITVVAHVVTVPAMLFFWFWYWYHPVERYVR